MKKKFAVMIAVAVCVLVCIGAALTLKTPESGVVAVEPENTSPLSARFLNMLNHNFVYGEDFASFDKIATGAVLSNLSSREGDYIPEAFVKGFAKDMYGINIVSFGNENDQNYKPGYVYVPHIGLTTFVHSNPAVSANEDGSYNVLTDVTVNPHDGAEKKATAVSLFVPNKESPFGFVLVYSSINESSASF